jgi:hypothetical protein
MAAETANAMIGALSKVARYAVVLGIGSSALQTSLYTGAFCSCSSVCVCVCVCVVGPARARPPTP